MRYVAPDMYGKAIKLSQEVQSQFWNHMLCGREAARAYSAVLVVVVLPSVSHAKPALFLWYFVTCLERPDDCNENVMAARPQFAATCSKCVFTIH